MPFYIFDASNVKDAGVPAQFDQGYGKDYVARLSQALGPREVTEPALAVRGLAKSFGGARALDGVDLTVGAREIHGLLGHNGSGKSTLVKILSGYHAPDPGAELRLHGEALRLPLSLAEQRARGLAFVHQNLGLVPQISVLENMRVVEITAARRPWVDWRAQRRAAVAALQQFGLAIDPDQPVSTLSPVERALVAIVRAFTAIDSTRSGPRPARPARARRADAVPGARRRRSPVPADAPGGRRGRERAVHLA